MKKTIVLLAAFLAGMTSCFGQNWNRISKAIKEKQKEVYFQFAREKYNRKTLKVYDAVDILQAYHIYRKRIDFPDMLHYNPMNDTIYILEKDEDMFFPDQFSTIFTRKDLLSYYCFASRRKNRFRRIPMDISRESHFYPYMLKLVAKWDLEGLKKEGEKNGMIPQNYIWITRVILSNKKYRIDCEIIKEFYNMERDDHDYYEYMDLDLPTVLKKIFE